MKRTILTLLTVFIIVSVRAQEEIWVQLTKGDALFLNPKTMEWEPITSKQKLPLKTYVLTKPAAELKIFKETDAYTAPAQSHFYLSDIFQHDKMQIVEELTSIELQQLPTSSQPDSSEEHEKIVGLTYGKPLNNPSSGVAIPYFEERMNAIEWFYNHQRYDAALLALKRTMVRFPTLYFMKHNTDLLCSLYDKLELYGFLYEETNRLALIKNDEEFVRMVASWNDRAKKKLTVK